MTTTPPEAPPGPDASGDPGPQGPQHGPRATRDDIRDLSRLRRTTGPDKKVAGVAGGLARHLDVDPLILRVALVVLVFFGGAGLIVYAACWLLVPEDGDERAPFNFDDRTRTIALLIAARARILLNTLSTSPAEGERLNVRSFLGEIRRYTASLAERRPACSRLRRRPAGEACPFPPGPAYPARRAEADYSRTEAARWFVFHLGEALG